MGACVVKSPMMCWFKWNGN